MTQIVDLIETYMTTRGYPPTVRELATELGVAVQTAHNRLREAESLGLIERDPGIPRGIRLTRGDKP